MAEAPDLEDLIATLSGNIDDLEGGLLPILKSSVSKSSSKLPLLDKAKLYVLICYTIESIIFSSLRLSNVNAKDHPVFHELARVRQYFEKIKDAEAGPTKKRENMSLDKAAAGRIVRHALSGNDRLDQERKMVAQEMGAAKAKLAELEAKMANSEASGSEDSTGGHHNLPSDQNLSRKRKKASDMWDDSQSAHNRDSNTDSAATFEKGTSSKSAKRSKSGKVPRSAHATFEALLKGPAKDADPSKKSKKGKKS
ncbi:hypothetical protein P152DRAFT_451533 [Eremomyces bilateralis CBS 781.70]|uniref:Exosome complex protein n=1 Tax=Eremomyces bilateralis CBS 781.70 TaxID=1392243 RepID=A0A6G1FW07_9PEZI|nr:uncharacterized protein P152DRAFT_451533 [Eremomyces bilateralis CBS 781.70]KAF1809870.1 hypothetical protein P152DRAFT_451533 [Eremomyces bilateralis CBS 781.70]